MKYIALALLTVLLFSSCANNEIGCTDTTTIINPDTNEVVEELIITDNQGVLDTLTHVKYFVRTDSVYYNADKAVNLGVIANVSGDQSIKLFSLTYLQVDEISTNTIATKLAINKPLMNFTKFPKTESGKPTDVKSYLQDLISSGSMNTSQSTAQYTLNRDYWLCVNETFTSKESLTRRNSHLLKKLKNIEADKIIIKQIITINKSTEVTVTTFDW